MLTLSVPDDLAALITAEAARRGVTAETLALEHLRSFGATLQFRSNFGAVDLGHATGVDDESIDADLASEYGRALDEN